MVVTVWQAQRAGICAGWAEAEGRALALAPILRRWHRPGRSLAETLRRAGFAVVLVRHHKDSSRHMARAEAVCE